jgi:hypothetical protein
LLGIPAFLRAILVARLENMVLDEGFWPCEVKDQNEGPARGDLIHQAMLRASDLPDTWSVGAVLYRGTAMAGILVWIPEAG